MPAANDGGARWGPGTPYAPPPPLSSASPTRRPKPTPKQQIVVGAGFGLLTAGAVVLASSSGFNWLTIATLVVLAWVAGATGYGSGAVLALMGAIVAGVLFAFDVAARWEAENGYDYLYTDLNAAFLATSGAIGVTLAWAVGRASRRLWFKSHS